MIAPPKTLRPQNAPGSRLPGGGLRRIPLFAAPADPLTMEPLVWALAYGCGFGPASSPAELSRHAEGHASQSQP
jgi:hypothetical protein